MNYNPKVTAYIRNAPAEQIVMLETLRELIHQTVQSVSEEIKWGFPVFATTHNIAYIRTAKQHITLGFYKIDNIQDPDNLLEGTGNTLKHIKFRHFDEINANIISQWLKEINQ